MKLLIRDGYLIDTEPQVNVLPHTDLLIDGDTIAAVGNGLDADGATEIDATGQLVLPGFVDSHRHTWQSPLRGMLPVGTLDEYLRRFLNTVGPRFRPADVYTANLAGALDCLDAGITTLLDWSHIQNSPDHSDAAVAGLRDAGIRGVFAHSFGLPITAEQFALPHSADARRVRNEHFATSGGLLTMALGVRGPDFGPADIAATDIRFARELGCRITVHVHGGAAIEALRQHDVLGPDITYVHGNRLDDDAIKLIADSGGSVSVSPQSEIQLALGDPITDRLHAHGVTTSLSIDTVTCTGGDMFTQLRGALAAGRGSLSAADVLGMATVGGAETLGLADRIGSLRPGKQADLVLLNCDTPGMAPAVDPVGALVTGADRSNVDTVLVAGRIVKRDGRLTHPDLPRALDLLAETVRTVQPVA